MFWVSMNSESKIGITNIFVMHLYSLDCSDFLKLGGEKNLIRVEIYLRLGLQLVLGVGLELGMGLELVLGWC